MGTYTGDESDRSRAWRLLMVRPWRCRGSTSKAVGGLSAGANPLPPSYGVDMKFTRRILGFAAMGLFGAAGQAAAQEIQFQGSTKGCFYTSSETSCVPDNSSTLMYLKY